MSKMMFLCAIFLADVSTVQRYGWVWLFAKLNWCTDQSVDTHAIFHALNTARRLLLVLDSSILSMLWECQHVMFVPQYYSCMFVCLIKIYWYTCFVNLSLISYHSSIHSFVHFCFASYTVQNPNDRGLLVAKIKIARIAPTDDSLSFWKLRSLDLT